MVWETKIVRLRQIFLSKWFYYLLITLTLLIFIFILLPYFVRNQVISVDFSYNLLSEFWGILFTVLLLITLVELREKLEWKSVRDKVIDMTKNELEDISKLVCIITDEQVKEPKQMEPMSIGRKIFSGPASLAKMILLKRLLRRQRVLDNIEAKYSNFLEPKLRVSLIELQEKFDDLSLTLELKEYYLKQRTEKEFFDTFFASMCKLYTMIEEMQKKVRM